MRLIIVSREIPARSGILYGIAARTGILEPSARLDQALRNELTGLIEKRFLFPAVERKIEELVLRAYDLGFERGLEKAQSPQESGAASEVLDTLFIGEQLADPLPFESRCLSVSAKRGLNGTVPFNAPVFLGHFSKEQYKAILQSDGGASRIHLFNSKVAQECFTRQGNGIIEDGLYLLHPKREHVIVPFKTFHREMLSEYTREAHTVMGRLGARRLTVATIEGVTFGGRVVSRLPGHPGGAAVEYTKNDERVVSYEWGTPTYDPETALEGCVWVQDNAAVMTIVDQRQKAGLSLYKEFTEVNTAFNASIEVLRTFEASFEWRTKSLYQYDVEFFDRARTGHG